MTGADKEVSEMSDCWETALDSCTRRYYLANVPSGFIAYNINAKSQVNYNKSEFTQHDTRVQDV